MESSSSIPRTQAQTLRDFERRRLLAWRASIDPGQRASADRAIGERLIGELAHHAAGTLALYWPIRGEPDLSGALARIAERGWTLALPKVTGRAEPLVFGRWQPGQWMRTVSFGLKLPEPFEAVLPDLLVIPCVGFDPFGYRLGYGAGYYDRTLALRAVPTIGVAYDGCALASFVPHAHDRPLDCVVTETQTVRGSTQRAEGSHDTRGC
jgi:5-formyltetrahydrofolate cyclo-ligase